MRLTLSEDFSRLYLTGSRACWRAKLPQLPQQRATMARRIELMLLALSLQAHWSHRFDAPFRAQRCDQHHLRVAPAQPARTRRRTRTPPRMPSRSPTPTRGPLEAETAAAAADAASVSTNSAAPTPTSPRTTRILIRQPPSRSSLSKATTAADSPLPGAPVDKKGGDEGPIQLANIPVQKFVVICVEINQCVGCEISRRWRGRAGSVER